MVDGLSLWPAFWRRWSGPARWLRSALRSGSSGRSGASASLLLAALFCLCLGGLAGCDPQKIAALEEGVATEADVRARFGEPEKIWEAADMASVPLQGVATAAKAAGARTFEYNRQPQGQVNYMITLGGDGRMTALRQVLTPENFARIVPGQSMKQVRKLLGRPAKVTPYALKRQTEYDWRYLEGSNRARLFTVVFDQDLRVVSTASVDEESVHPSGGSR